MATVAKQRVMIRAMSPEDVDEVIKVEHKAYDFPWSRGIFEDCLRVGYICRVMESTTEAIGHTVISVAAGEAHLLNLCVAPAAQGAGLGRRLLAHAVNAARLNGAQRMILEVRPSNWRALRLYQSAGFDVVGRRRGYYPDQEGREDALVLAKPLIKRRRPAYPADEDDD